MVANSVIASELEAGKKKCPRGSHKSRSKKEGKRGHCVRTESHKRRYSTHRRSSLTKGWRGGEADISGGSITGGEIVGVQIDTAVAAVLTGGADAAVLEAGRRHCPRGSHISRSGKNGKSKHCVRTEGGHRRYSRHRRASMTKGWGGAVAGGDVVAPIVGGAVEVVPVAVTGGAAPVADLSGGKVVEGGRRHRRRSVRGGDAVVADVVPAVVTGGAAVPDVEGGRRRRRMRGGSPIAASPSPAGGRRRRGWGGAVETETAKWG